MCQPFNFFALLIIAMCSANTAQAGWWQDPSFGNARGAATGNNTIFNSPYYNPNLPAGGMTPYPYYGTQGYGVMPSTGGYYPPIGAPVAIGGGYFGVKAGGTMLHYWKAPSGYYYPWVYGGYAYGYSYPLTYQSGQMAQARPPLVTEFRDMQDYLDESKSKGRISEGDYTHLNRRLHDLISKSQDITSNGDNADLDSGVQQDVSQLGLEISHRIKPAP